VTELRPLASDRATARALVRRAVLAHNDPEAETAPFLSMLEREVANDTAVGVLRYDGETPIGIAVWDPMTELGAMLQVVFLVPASQSAESYRAFYSEILGAAGSIVFAPGRLSGLSDADEVAVMEGLGFAPFSRSEMRFPPDVPTPIPPQGSPNRVREVRADEQSDLARLHELAYRNHFDRYLFQADPDPVRDAAIAMRDIASGRWGEFLPWASVAVDGDGGLAAATLVVRAGYGPLIADVMVDPGLQGRGLGRTVVAETIRRLRERNEPVIVLNVTEGNARAVRLYEQLGFVRSIGPSRGWYFRQRIPVTPDSH
jgi:ribosomal protein S18 acetylase RimI-like enzyme